MNVAIKENRVLLRLPLGSRAVIVALALFLEKLALTFLVDYGPVLTKNTGFAAIVGEVQHGLFRFAAAFVLSLAVFTYAHDKKRRGLQALSLDAMEVGWRWRWLLLHIALLLILAPLSFCRYRVDAFEFEWLIGLSLLVGVGAVAALFASCAPWEFWWSAAKRLGSLLIYAAIAAGIAVTATQWSQSLWAPASKLTFRLVWYVLVPFIPSLAGDARTLVLSSNAFSVHIANSCSGLEGAGLMLSFCSAWLICFRKEYDFPRALLLIPVGLLISLTLNVVRIACLMLIGYSGYPAIAVYGFHSQAGWIAFICAAGLVAVISQKLHWMRSSGQSSISTTRSCSLEGARQVEMPYAQRDSTAAYLLPLLALLAGAIIAKSLSAGFEYWYVLRLLLGIGALMWCWPRLRSLDWSFGWRGLLAGVALFVVYVIGGAVRGIHGNMPAALSAMPELARIGWLSIRVGAAVLVVPVAEELAFRGYLMRRLVTRDFESLPFSEVGVTGLVLSALIYGLENRSAWFEAIVVGLLLGILQIRRRKMGEIVVAHAVTNALLATCVIFFDKWQYWK